MKNKSNLIFPILTIGMFSTLFVQPLWADRSPYMTRVLEFMPAPGQFVHELPEYEAGFTAEDMRLAAESYLLDNAKGMVSLGGFGGYITVGFDHTIANVPGEYDFTVLGNAFYSPVGEDKKMGGSCEPGVIMVSQDANGNGLADDAWYEIAGSEYTNPATQKEYEVTYHRPAPAKQPVTDPAQPQITDLEYIRWTDNGGNEGYLAKNKAHSQNYYPEWIVEDKFTFKGTRLQNNSVDMSGNGNYFVLFAYEYGYADNHPNDKELAKIKIDWAVDAQGTPANLSGIDFIRIHTGVHQQNGWLGECSTEVLGAIDLHPGIEASLARVERTMKFSFYPNPCRGLLTVETEQDCEIKIRNIDGNWCGSFWLETGKNQLDLSGYVPGMYLIQGGGSIGKVWVR